MKYYSLILFVLILISCKPKSDNNQISVGVDSIASVNETVSNISQSFDINSIPVTHADVGVCPYLSAPEGYLYSKDEHRRKYGEKYFFYNDSLVMTVKGVYYHTRIIPNDDGDFSASYIVRSYEQAVEKLGGVEVYGGKIVDKAVALLTDNEMEYIGDMYDPYPYNYKQFLLKTPSGNIWIELCWGLNIYAVDYTVLSEAEMKETIHIIKADKLKDALDKDGKAILYIQFATNKSDLMPQGVQAVEEIGKLLDENAELNLSIEGHTDDVGTDEHNYKLSLGRAQAVVEKLKQLNIDTNRLGIKGYGSAKPLAPNNSDENRAKNRRVEIVKF